MTLTLTIPRRARGGAITMGGGLQLSPTPRGLQYLLGPFTFDTALGGLQTPYMEPLAIQYLLGPFSFDAALGALLTPYTEPAVPIYLLGPFTFDTTRTAPLNTTYSE